MKLAAIDIGSNAARLLVSEVSIDEEGRPSFTRVNLTRVPLRLGFDVFDTGGISDKKKTLLLQTIRAFSYLLQAYEVSQFKACATSAMRESSNAAEIIDLIKNETGIQIEIISGNDEASFIYENHIAESLDNNRAYLYVDVGGGSTEITFFANNEMVFKDSFDIGTIRILQNKVSQSAWQEMKDTLKKQTEGYDKVITIGSGGNINKIYTLSKQKDMKPLHLDVLVSFLKVLGDLSIADRINIYKMREDRADVIVPALQIYVNVMRWSGSEEIYVPKIGLADGLVQHLWKEMNEKNNQQTSSLQR